MNCKIGFLASLGFTEMAPRKVCASLKKLGYESVEWTLSHVNPREKSLKDIKGVLKTASRQGLITSEIVVQRDYVALNKSLQKDNVKFTLECIDVFSDAGINCICLFTGPVPWDQDAPVIGKNIKEEKAWDMVFAAFDKIVSHAEKKKINLAVENVWGMLAHDFYSCKFLIDKYDRNVLGVNFDPSHDVLAGNLDVAWIIKQWNEKIKHCHIKDAAGIPKMGKFVFPLIGEGLVDWNAFFGALDDIGFCGTCSVEFESFNYYRQVLGSNPVEAARISMEIIKKIIKRGD